MTMKKPQYHSYNQSELKFICDQLCDRIEDLLETLDVSEVRLVGKMVVGTCPIHGGDNPSAFNLYPEGESYRGNWKCRTQGCDSTFKGSIIGFIRGVLSSKKYGWSKEGDNTASFNETIEFIKSFLQNDLTNIKICTIKKEKQNFSIMVNNIKPPAESLSSKSITKEHVRKSLTIPCSYFLDRGFTTKILDKYDVGTCNISGKEMYGRAVVPIYDNDYSYLVGCSGRSLFDKCPKCGLHHNPELDCPEKAMSWTHSKWRHNKDLKSQNHLYNFWFAKEYILKSAQVVLVESPGNVWRLEEAGIHNSVGMFGSSLSDRQKMLLDGSGAMTIIILTDNDAAGEKAATSIKNKCKNTYKVVHLPITKADVAELSVSEIHEQILPTIEKHLC